MSVYETKPWLSAYAEGHPAEIVPAFGDALSMVRATIARNPDGDAIRYFGRRISWRELDALTDAFAAGLLARGLVRGDRVALYLQNVPQFVLALVGTWKAGGIAVSINPMNRERELDLLLKDSGARVLVCLEGLYRDVAASVVPGTGVELVLTTSELDYCGPDVPPLLACIERMRFPGTLPLAELLAEAAGQVPPPVTYGSEDIAFLTYTSGTTGAPKGAMNTHGNVVFNAQVYRDWCGLTPDDVILAIAPLFHITGLIGHVALSLILGAPLVLMYRFDPAVVLDTIAREKPTYTVGAITAFIALMNHPAAATTDFSSLKKINSGGAPIPPAIARAFQDKVGAYIHNIYGLTETTSPSHCVPTGASAPVDPQSGALSVGLPVYNTIVRIIGEDGHELPPGEIGEIVTEGPQVVAGYWNKPEETAHALPGRRLYTGDVGYMDANGWFYLVDRKKDQINASGYKVWPREVEDVLYEHAAVREAAVVGVADPYRGETVKAFVSLRPGETVSIDDLIVFCKDRLAAYKYPRVIEIVEDLPKTATGKILRRQLRG